MNRKLSSNLSQHDRIVRRIFLPTLVLLLLLAYWNRFIQDDAFISFRYAFNLVHGQGLTWNPGEPIEGYTNFLWTLLMAIPIALNIDPVGFSQVLGLFFALGTLLLTYRLALLLFDSMLPAYLSTVLLGTNYTFSAYATGGLETQMQTFFVAASTYLALSMGKQDKRSYGRLAGFSLLCAAALLTRLDSAIPYVVLIPYLLWHIVKQPADLGQKATRVVLLLGPATLIVSAWFVWKYQFYGDVLPNTFYAKATLSTVDIVRQGILYLYKFVDSYFLIPFVILAIFFVFDIMSRTTTRLLACIILLWGLYILRVGGDFMEFRFLVPVLPFVFILIVDLIFVVKHEKVRAGLMAVILIGSLVHGATFTFAHGIESVRSLKEHLTREEENWIGVGLVLGELFSEHNPEVVIATTAAGAIPYYSKLYTVDMLGLNDRWVARNGTIHSPHPGHQRIATPEYLVGRSVHLLVGPPLADPVEIASEAEYTIEDLDRFFVVEVEPDQVPEAAVVLDLPMGGDYTLPVIYLTSHQAIDDLIAEKKLTTHEIIR